MVEASAAAAAGISPPSSPERAIDLVHLARMTFGDRRLEREVLELFDRQAQMLIGRMNRSAPAAVATLAHTLKGSARGIGAKRVARAADEVELAAAEGEATLRPAIGMLEAAVEEARAVIADLLRSP